MSMTTRPPLAEALDLQPHPEGGWFRETFRSKTVFHPDGYAGPRNAATAIYFLLQPGESSAWHVVKSDELWLLHSGSLELSFGGDGPDPQEPGETVVLDRANPQGLIPAGVWQAARPAGDEPVLVSCVVSPGFDFEDFRMA
ncbi:cupin domain-containing protein [Winogradskya consettensis]|uniref:cupin domain-containing protein n=1 Tax=Winogradskya consettensis TaxID=113560 RepID=UPI003F68E394